MPIVLIKQSTWCMFLFVWDEWSMQLDICGLWWGANLPTHTHTDTQTYTHKTTEQVDAFVMQCLHHTQCHTFTKCDKHTHTHMNLPSWQSMLTGSTVVGYFSSTGQEIQVSEEGLTAVKNSNTLKLLGLFLNSSGSKSLGQVILKTSSGRRVLENSWSGVTHTRSPPDMWKSGN